MLAFSLFGKTKIDTRRRERGYNMLIGCELINTYRIRHAKIILVSVIIILGIALAFSTLRDMPHVKETVSLAKPEAPLLLNSGMVQTNEAELSIILWFDGKDIPLNIRSSKPTPDWIWTYKELQKNNDSVSATLVGQSTIHKSEEKNLYAWYTTMVPQIEKSGGRIYLDERVPQVIDISAYLCQMDAEPTQWVQINNMTSAAAYQKNIMASVTAGQEQINIQLLSRGKGNEGQSALAIPVLLKEF